MSYDAVRLTDKERKIAELLAQAINEAQSVIGMRVARRVDPEFWK